MTKLELLNVFLNDRLTAAADDIFRAVKDTVVEYQAELLRSKEENERLKRLLNAAVQRLLLQPGGTGERKLPKLSLTGNVRDKVKQDSVSEIITVTAASRTEPQSEQLPENGELLEQEWRCAEEQMPLVKVEPKLLSPCSDEGRRSEEEAGSVSKALPAQTGCGRQSVFSEAQLLQIKTERDEVAVSGPQRASSLNNLSPCSVSSDCHASPANRTQTQVSGPRALVRSSGNPPRLQLKNSVRLPPPHSSGQSLQKWHSCKECGKGFSFACQLEVHMRWHTKEKPYCCAVCRKSFTTVSMLKRHHRIHTGEKPFHCHVCGKRFNQSAHLNTHFRLHTRERASRSRTPLCK